MDEPTYIIAAVKDWQAGRISRDRLFEIFRVNLFVLYEYINDEDKVKPVNELIGILDKAISKTVYIEHS